MKLDDVLAKQATHQTIVQTLELEFRAVKDYLYMTSDLTASTSASPASPVSPLRRKSTPQMTSEDFFHQLQRAGPTGDDQDMDPCGSQSESSITMQNRRSIESYIDHSLSSPWGNVPRNPQRSMSAVSRVSQRKTSVLHGNFEYSTIADGIDVADCMRQVGVDRRRRKLSAAAAPLMRSEAFHTLTPVSSRCDDMESETEQNLVDDEAQRESAMRSYEEQGAHAAKGQEGEDEREVTGLDRSV